MLPLLFRAAPAVKLLFDQLVKKVGKKEATRQIMKKAKNEGLLPNSKQIKKSDKPKTDKPKTDKQKKEEFDEGYKQEVRKKSEEVGYSDSQRIIKRTDLPSEAARRRNATIKKDVERFDYANKARSELKDNTKKIKKRLSDRYKTEQAFIKAGEYKKGKPIEKIAEDTKKRVAVGKINSKVSQLNTKRAEGFRKKISKERKGQNKVIPKRDKTKLNHSDQKNVQDFLFTMDGKPNKFNGVIAEKIRNKQPLTKEQKQTHYSVGKYLSKSEPNIPEGTMLSRGANLKRTELAKMLKQLKKGEQPKIKNTYHTFASKGEDTAKSYIDTVPKKHTGETSVIWKYPSTDKTRDMNPLAVKMTDSRANKGVVTKQGTKFKVKDIKKHKSTGKYGGKQEYYEIQLDKVTPKEFSKMPKAEKQKFLRYLLSGAGTTGAVGLNNQEGEQ